MGSTRLIVMAVLLASVSLPPAADAACSEVVGFFGSLTDVLDIINLETAAKDVNVLFIQNDGTLRFDRTFSLAARHRFTITADALYAPYVNAVPPLGIGASYVRVHSGASPLGFGDGRFSATISRGEHTYQLHDFSCVDKP